MSRVYLLQDARGERQLTDQDLPLRVGGEQAADLALPGLTPDAVIAYIALSGGHAYIQPAADGPDLFHNHQRIQGSAWLKSGDQVEAGAGQLTWKRQGDQVWVHAEERPALPELTPPGPAPSHPVVEQAPPIQPPPVRPRRRGLGMLLGLLFAVLLLAAVFELFAVRVDLRVEPAPDQLSLTGMPPAIPLWGRWLAWPGGYRIEARHKGYHPLTEQLELSRDGRGEFYFQLRELPGRLQLTVEPQVPFRLLVDGAPASLDASGVAHIPRGPHRLRLESDRYLPEELEIEIAGLGQTQTLSRVLRPAWAQVTISSQPPGAEVRADGLLLGQTPLSTELLQGHPQIQLTLPGHKAVTLTPEIRAGEALALEDIPLPPADAQLRLDSQPQGASLTLDGRFRGSTPLELTLSSRQNHQLQLSKPGYRSTKQQLQLEPEETRSLTLRLEPEYGVVFITSRPVDAKLLVDGQPAGPATQRLRLTTRSHQLELRKKGYRSKQLSVLPNAGFSQNLEVELSPLATGRPSRTDPNLMTTAAGQRMRLVRPRGSFRMGASRREAGRRANESQRLVELSRPFYLGEKEVSNGEFRRFRPAHDSGSAEGHSLNADQQPAVNVGWEDAARYCNWLSQRDGLPPAYKERNGKLRLTTPVGPGYRLPSEAEWAYAARVLGRKSPARYPWDQGYPPTRVSGNYADARIADSLADVLPNYDDGYRVSAPVGSFTAGPGGFYDIGGNVAEWSNDYYAVYPGEAERLVSDPLGPADGDHHLIRGAGWRQATITELRLTYRDYSREARPDLGFRIARYAEP